MVWYKYPLNRFAYLAELIGLCDIANISLTIDQAIALAYQGDKFHYRNGIALVAAYFLFLRIIW